MPTQNTSMIRAAGRWLLAVQLLFLCGTALAGTKHYYYTDPQGTPLAKADAQGNIVERYEYTPYGISVPNVGASPNGVGYTGHVNDPETGLVYMQARYYDPAVGRFLSVDPVAAAENPTAAFNRYWYANNSPYRFIDPDGKQCYGYGTNQPCAGGRIYDCHQTNSCKSLAEADAIVRSDAKSLVAVQGTIAIAAGVVAASPTAIVLVTKAVSKQAAAKALCVSIPLICNPLVNNSRSLNNDHMSPPESSGIDTMKRLEELERDIAKYVEGMNKTTRQRPPPPPSPPSPTPTEQGM